MTAHGVDQEGVLAQKYAACVRALNPEMTCNSCAHDKDGRCSSKRVCYGEVLGMPVNPTQWVAR